MLRPTKLSRVAEAPAFDDDPALFETNPHWFIPGLKPLLGEQDTDDDVALGFRSMLDHPDVLSDAWRSLDVVRSGDGVRRVRRRPRRSATGSR